MEILDEGLGKQRNEAEESEFQLLKMDAEVAIKNIRNGTIALFVIAGLLVVISLFIMNTNVDTMFGNAENSFFMGIGLIMYACVYGVLALLSKKYAVVCFIIALCFYFITNFLDVMENPATLAKGIILKVMLIWIWVKALQGALAMKKLIQQASYLGASEADLRA